MKTYRIKLILHSHTLTLFQADTIFGHMCWVIAHKEGDEKLQEFLAPFMEDNPPFLISDGFPNDLLPKPFSAEIVFDSDKRKEIKKIEFVNVEEFDAIRKGKECEIRGHLSPIKYTNIPHSKISRITGTTFTEGGLYSLEEYFVDYLSIYLKVISAEWKDRVISLLSELSKSGYGSKKSVGKGQFKVDKVEESKLGELPNANGFVTLSNFCPKANDPIEGLYKTFVKYGKLGEEFTFCGNPFKKPLVMIKTGSLFKTETYPNEFYGRMIKEIAPAKQDVVQYAYAFTIPIMYPKLEE